jgi:hypothetical protein
MTLASGQRWQLIALLDGPLTCKLRQTWGPRDIAVDIDRLLTGEDETKVPLGDGEVWVLWDPAQDWEPCSFPDGGLAEAIVAIEGGLSLPYSKPIKDYSVARKRSTIAGSIGSTASVWWVVFGIRARTFGAGPAEHRVPGARLAPRDRLRSVAGDGEQGPV